MIDKLHSGYLDDETLEYVADMIVNDLDDEREKKIFILAWHIQIEGKMIYRYHSEYINAIVPWLTASELKVVKGKNLRKTVEWWER